MTETIKESNTIIHPEMGEVPMEAFTIYTKMMNASKSFAGPPCSLCKLNPDGIRSHFHGTEFGKCFRQNQYKLLLRQKRSLDDVHKNVFLYDGHLHEDAANWLLSQGYKVSHKDEEIVVKRFVDITVSGNVVRREIEVVCHTDMILETEKRKFVVEFKAVKNWFTKNRFQQNIIPNAYFGQIQVYLEAHNLDDGLLFFKNRESSEIFPPFVIKRDPVYIDTRFKYLAGVLHSSSKMEVVPKEYSNKNCDACKFCDYYKQCWE